jgi:flagella basal body P-ring formation protein FlgA
MGLVLVALSAADAQRPLDAAALTRVLRTHIAGTLSCEEADVEVRSAGNVEGISVPEGDVSLRILQKGVPASYRNLLVGVEITKDNRPIRTFWVTVDASVRGRFPRIRRRVPYGAALVPADVEMVEADIRDLRARYLKSEQEAVGQVARRLLVPGDALVSDMLAAPYLVRNGQTVRLRIERDRIVAAALVRAEQDGRLGQTVTVRNLDFSRRLKARVVGPGEVMID